MRLTLAETAPQLDNKPRQLRCLIKKKQLQARKRSGAQIIEDSALSDFDTRSEAQVETSVRKQ